MNKQNMHAVVEPAFGRLNSVWTKLLDPALLCHKDSSTEKSEKHDVDLLPRPPGEGHGSPRDSSACSRALSKAMLADSRIQLEPSSFTQIPYLKVQCFFYNSVFF